MEKLLNLIFPKRCLGCGRVGKYFCADCSKTIHTIQLHETICPVCERSAMEGITHPRCQRKYSIDGLISLYHYEGVIQKALKFIKYRFISDIAEELLQKTTLTSHIINMPIDKPRTVFVPVPLHKKRLRSRGFNQALIFAQFLAKTANLPVVSDLLIRIKLTVPQVEMKQREKRLKNTEGVFALREDVLRDLLRRYRMLSVFLVDDVFTTGATMRAAAKVLKKAGVSRVWGVSIAR